MKYWIPGLLLSLFFGACTDTRKKSTLDVTEESIDLYVAGKLDTSQVYTIVEGLRYSKGNATYQASQFSQNDTVILCTEEITAEDGSVLERNIFFQEDLPVYVEEYETILSPDTILYNQRKIYFNGSIVLKAYEKTAGVEEELWEKPFQEVTMTMSRFDFDRPKEAAMQEGDYEMKFGEFLVFDLQSFLVLENEESGYSVALFILKGDDLLNALYENPEAYRGKTIRPYHEFMNIGGMERMVYKGGQVIN